MNAQDKNDEKQQRPDGGYWAESRNDPGTTKGEVSNGKGGASGAATGSSTDDDSNLTGTDLQPGDQNEQEHAMHMTGQRYDAAAKDASGAPSASTMKEDEQLFDEGQATTPGTSGRSGGPEASSGAGPQGKSSGQHGAGSGGSGTGEAGALSHEAGAPGLAGGTSASGTSDEEEGDVTLGSGGTGAGLPDGTKGN